MSHRHRPASRLRKRSEFESCQKEGRRYHSRRLVLLHHGSERSGARLGIVVTRKTGGAVVRNRWKRVVREFFRLERERIADRGDYVVIVRSTIQGPPERDIRIELRTLFSKVKVS